MEEVWPKSCRSVAIKGLLLYSQVALCTFFNFISLNLIFLIVRSVAIKGLLLYSQVALCTFFNFISLNLIFLIVRRELCLCIVQLVK